MSMAVTAITIQGVGALSGAIGARNTAAGQKMALQYGADIADINARTAELSAQSALLTGQRQEQRVLMRGAQIKSAQRASMAANGIDMGGSDTATRLLASTQFMAESDALTISSNARQQADQIRMQSVNATNDARMKRATADGIDPDSAFTSSLLGSAGQVASSWYTLNKSGGFDWLKKEK